MHRLVDRQNLLFLYDILILAAVEAAILIAAPSTQYKPGLDMIVQHIMLFTACMFGVRCIFGVYRHVLRYGGSSAYMRLIASDILSGVLYYFLQIILPVSAIEFIRVLSIVTLNMTVSLSMRLSYLFIYEYAKRHPQRKGGFWRLVSAISGFAIPSLADNDDSAQLQKKINIAIVGAGKVGALLAEELLNNPQAEHFPRCFIDIDASKIGREIVGVPVIAVEEATEDKLNSLGIREIVFALPSMNLERKKALYEQYRSTGFKLKVYDNPTMQSPDGGKRKMREFSIEELLFRNTVELRSEETGAYYRGKVVLITGGGGSIGSELCRQIARMAPKHLVILDVYENGAYDIQQELKLAYGDSLQISVEITSVCDRRGLEKVFADYHPDVLLHAAAHKHVPLMERNCCEAVKNNVFGTRNTVELAIQYKVGKFVMISTDKAVNPTNVMGATKRMCEMIMQGYSCKRSDTTFSIVRFGNVLGSAGSVIPLFKRQIARGGPVTVTDKRIIRYFMTIPEASQLVLEAGAMAKNDELFVLDMGNPVRILELAENMIRLSGFEPYIDIDIVETGLRPGEKLYEELLIRSESLDKTENSLIFIERETPISYEAMKDKLDLLAAAVEEEDDEKARHALMLTVPTYRHSDEVNRGAIDAKEMKMAGGEGKM